MSAVLLDTHTVLWAFLGSKELSPTVIDILNDSNVTVFVSPISAYELSFKAQLGKLQMLPKSFEALAEAADFSVLPLTLEHFELAGRLPLVLRDPWDRLLSAQSIREDMPLLSRDEKIALLGAKVIW